MAKPYTTLLEEHGSMIAALDQMRAEVADMQYLIGSLAFCVLGLTVYMIWKDLHE